MSSTIRHTYYVQVFSKLLMFFCLTLLNFLRINLFDIRLCLCTKEYNFNQGSWTKPVIE